MYMSALPICMCTVCVWCPRSSEEGSLFPRTRDTRQLWAIMWMLRKNVGILCSLKFLVIKWHLSSALTAKNDKPSFLEPTQDLKDTLLQLQQCKEFWEPGSPALKQEDRDLSPLWGYRAWTPALLCESCSSHGSHLHSPHSSPAKKKQAVSTRPSC